MAGTAKNSKPELKLIENELKECPSDSKEKLGGQKATLRSRLIWTAKRWAGTFGICAVLTLGIVGLKYLGDEKWEGKMSGFNVRTNIVQLLDDVGERPSGTREMAMQNLETIEKVGEGELIELREAIEEVERECNGCGELLGRLKAVEKRWKAYVERKEEKPVSDLRWKRPAIPKMPVLKRVPQKLARSMC